MNPKLSLPYDFLHRGWRMIPPSFRRWALQEVSGKMAPRARDVSLKRGTPIYVAGFLSTSNGLGESARLCLTALQQLGYEAYGVDLSGGAMRQPVDIPFEQAKSLEDLAGRDGVLIVHVQASLMPLALMCLGGRAVSGKRLIGYWAWELEDIPPDWRKGLNFVDEIWVPSSFTAQAFAQYTQKPIRIIGHPVPAPAVVPTEKDSGRQDARFTVVTVFNMASSYARKNPMAAIRAFHSAFEGNPDCRLLLKVSHADAFPEGMAELEGARTRNIDIVTGEAPRHEVENMIGAADVVLSLHRSEGFGLILAEAMRRAHPVVATAWSGNMDFMNTENSIPVSFDLVPAKDSQRTYNIPSCRWAEAHIEKAAGALHHLYISPEVRNALGEAAQRDAERLFSLDAYKAAIGEALGAEPTQSAAIRNDSEYS